MEKEKDLSIREVISTNQNFYQSLQNDALKMVSREKEKMWHRQLPLPIAYSEFRELFVLFGSSCLFKRNQNRNFIIDDNNESVIEQLYYFITNNPSFSGDLNRGIMLQGKYGCGKTVILETYSMLHNHIVTKYSLRQPLFLFIKSLD